MLLGVLAAEPRSLWESREASTGQTEDELVELLVREIERGARGAARRSPRSGLGSRRRSTTSAGVAVSAVNLPIADLPIRDLVCERAGLPVFVDNDANVAALAEFLYGAARGAATW